uniref:Major facilitator superfamily (MFS) profile domain-containing protein n=1 Tax=Arundo donax TaxID=35708 RepID=A0A0A9FJS7_ARUDO
MMTEFPALLVDRIGRKVSMGGMLLQCCAFLAPLSVHLGQGLVTILLFCARTCIMGSFAVLHVHTPEVCTKCHSSAVYAATFTSAVTCE